MDREGARAIGIRSFDGTRTAGTRPLRLEGERCYFGACCYGVSTKGESGLRNMRLPYAFVSREGGVFLWQKEP